MNHGIQHYRSQALIDYACRYAAAAHGAQLRKYTDTPYIEHPIAVAQLVASVTDDCEVISAAFLHDVIEDTEVSYEDLVNAGFGPSIGKLVLELTDVSLPHHGNRATRKALDRAHLANASPRAQTVKLADLINNSCSIITYDPKFAKVYMQEMDDLLDVMTEGHPKLYLQAVEIIYAWEDAQ